MDNTYFIGGKCVGCGGCHSRCPASCIDATKKPLVIDENRCTGCGICYLACPIRAIEIRQTSMCQAAPSADEKYI